VIDDDPDAIRDPAAPVQSIPRAIYGARWADKTRSLPNASPPHIVYNCDTYAHNMYKLGHTHAM